MSVSPYEANAYYVAGQIAILAEFSVEIFGVNFEPSEDTKYPAGIRHENLFRDRRAPVNRGDECFRQCLQHMTLLLGGIAAEACFDPEHRADLEDPDYKESLAMAMVQCQDRLRAAYPIRRGVVPCDEHSRLALAPGRGRGHSAFGTAHTLRY